MTELPDEEAMAAAASPGDVRAMRILQGALTAGPLLFAAIALLLPFPPRPEAAPPPQVLLVALAFVTLGAWSAAMALPGARFRAHARKVREVPPSDAAAACAAWTGELRGARILTLALLEGSALFGAVVVFLHRSAGIEPAARPELWGALAPLAVFVAYSAASWPGDRWVASEWRRHVLGGA